MKRKRSGFTLIELTVVIGVMITMMALVFILGSGIQSRNMVVQAATDVQGWAKMAQVGALRDQRQYGIRLVGAGTGTVRQILFIEQPNDYVPPNVSITLNGSTATASGGNFSTTAVLPGDFLEVYTGANAKLHLITAASASTLTLQPTWAGASPTTTYDYRIVRRPRVRDGEPALDLPVGVIIDTSTATVYPGGALPTYTGGNLDIIFGPDGRVVTPGAQGQDIKLWVRDTSTDAGTPATDRYLKEPLLVVINLQTGLIAVHPINPNQAGDPYIFTKDGRSSGF